MALIHLHGLGMITPRPLFQGITLTIGAGDRIGLVAGNGCGKSTLLRCVAGQTEPDQGHVSLSRGMRPAFMEQDVPAPLLDLPLAEAIRRALPAAARPRSAWRVGATLDALAVPDALRERPLRALSGSWQRLAVLARAWVTEPALLLLDEPTNHLDAQKIEAVEAWLLGPAAGAALLVASHDRAFLDACTTRTLFLRPGVTRLYDHPYSRARALLDADDAAQERANARTAKEAGRLRRNAGALHNIGVNSGSDLLLKKSMQLRDRAERLEEAARPTHAERSGTIRLDSRASHARIAIAVRDLVVDTPDGTVLFRIPRLDVRQGDRLVLLGGNGAGKSRLMGLLHRAATQAVPGIEIPPGVSAGYVAQGMAHLPAQATPHGLVAASPGIGDGRATALLAGAGIGVEMHRRPAGLLSPGQRARLGLLLLRLAAPSLYLLDEPTNHVDIPGQEQLEAELLAQRATCVLVCHDRRFAQTVGTRFLHIAGSRVTEADETGG